MSISFDKALGIHEKALGFRSQRAEVLANNIANADTADRAIQLREERCGLPGELHPAQ